MDAVGSEATLHKLRDAMAATYAIERELGRGGMATVYLARDLRHRRAVALKVLHPELSAMLGPERFLKEIELTAGLQHPHILPLFDSGDAGGSLYYVMPYVDGESLRARLARERLLSVDEAVRITREVASALDYAHRHGVVHRDVKPENILLHDGAALVADFGIALAVAHASGERITQTGFSLGTPQYMAPEQAMAERDIDARADIYALGVVLYEMLSGEPPFTGPTAQAVVARVMTDRPRPLAAARDTVPPHVETAVMTALARVPADRFASAAAFSAALAPTIASATPSAPRSASRSAARAIGLVAAGALAVGAALGWVVARVRGNERAATGSAGRGPVRFAITIDSGTLGTRNWWTSGPAISPDGRTIVYAATSPTGARLYARDVGDVGARPIAGTEDADWPFFSPDGKWVGFASGGALRKVRLDGGSPITITEVPAPQLLGGADWGANDTIFYATLASGSLYRVAAAGGAPLRITVSDTSQPLLHPHRLPDGRALVVSVTSRLGGGARIGVLDLATGRLRRLGTGNGPRYLAGHLYYSSAAGELYRQAFDLDALTLRGNPEEIARGLDVIYGVNAAFDVSDGGTLVHRASAGRSKLALTDRAGREQRTLPGSLPWEPRFSPDGRRIAYAAPGLGADVGDMWATEVWRNDIWVTDLGSGATLRITTDGRDNNEPRWNRDGTRLAFSSVRRNGEKDVFVRTLDGAPATPVVERPGHQWPADFTPDGRALLFIDQPPDGTDDVLLQDLKGGAARPYVATSAREPDAAMSPDGRWIAYTSDETGRHEIYLQAFPIPGARMLVSTNGGTKPRWRGDSRELYYWQADELIAASLAITPGTRPTVRRTTLFRAPSVDPTQGYDVSPDGSRFAVVMGAPRATQLIVALDALVPSK